MNKIISAALLAVATALSGCSNPVPSVPDPVPLRITVDGQTLTQQQFLEKYCAGQSVNETCVRVSRAMAAWATRSESGPKRF